MAVIAVTAGHLDLSLDVSAVPARPGGAGYYTMALARGLAERDDVGLTLLARRGDEPRWHGLAGGAGVRGVVPVSRPGRLVYEQVRLGGPAGAARLASIGGLHQRDHGRDRKSVV